MCGCENRAGAKRWEDGSKYVRLALETLNLAACGGLQNLPSPLLALRI